MSAIVLVGALGRMGQAVAAAAAEAGLSLAARVDEEGILGAAGGEGAGNWAHVVEAGHVVVEFSSAPGARQAAAVCAERGAALVSGSTGLSAEDEAAVREASQHVAVVRASNFSLGVAALRVALRAALAAVPGDWDVEIVERHHRAKRDSPSGTARTLASDVLAARGLTPVALRHGREGWVGPRPSTEVGVHAVRGGSWVGDHQVLLAGPGEWIELRHVAQDRAAFAHGAVAAARFASTAAPGWYTMEDVLRGPGRA